MNFEQSNGYRRRMRVLHVGKFYLPHVGGMETHLRTLCHGLKEAVDLSVIVANDGPRTERALMDGVSVTRLATAVNACSTPICPQMTRAIRNAHADLVHVHLPNPWAVAAYLLSGHRGALVASWHSDVIRYTKLDRAFEVFSRIFVRRCKAIIASSDNYVESSPVLSLNRELCSVVPYGISITDFRCHNAGRVKKIRQRFGSRIVLSAGRLVYYKGLDYLIRAMDSVDARLLIVGDGPLRGKLRAEAAANPVIRNRVHFLGRVEDVAPYYHACDVFALPSIARSEGFGIVQLEAMACAKPVVNTRLQSGVPFVSLDGVTGITVAPQNSAQMAGALNRLLDEDELRRTYGNAALQRVRTEFTVGAMVKGTLAVYRKVAGSGSATDHAEQQVAESAGLVSTGT